MEKERGGRPWDLISDAVERIDDVAASGELDADLLQRSLSGLRSRLLEAEFEPLSVAIEAAREFTARLNFQRSARVRFEADVPALWVTHTVGAAIRTTLLHSVRNVFAHALRSGQPDTAQVIRIRSGWENGAVHLLFEDDGPGLPNQIEGDPYERIFEPGFTTLAGADEVAGRGMGLDAVRSEILALGGRIRAHPVQPRGLGLSLSIPLHELALEARAVRWPSFALWVPSFIGSRAEPHPEEQERVIQMAEFQPGEKTAYLRVRDPHHGIDSFLPALSIGEPRLQVFRQLDEAWRTHGSESLRRWLILVEGSTLAGKWPHDGDPVAPLADAVSLLAFFTHPAAE